MSLPEGVSAKNNHAWKNEPAENLHQLVRTHYDVWNHGGGQPDWRVGVRNLKYVIEQAQRTGRRIRAAGSTWSMSPVVPTPDCVVNVRPLNLLLPALTSGELLPGVEPGRLVHVQAGTLVGKLNRHLRQQGWALKTTGASDGQTLGGAVSTGTHGSGLERGSMADYVRALHVLTESGRGVWVERASTRGVEISWEAGGNGPITQASFSERLGAELIRDDDLFDAAIVGFGSFGLIHSLVLEVDRLRLVKRYRRQRSLDAALRRALHTLDFTGLELPGGAERPYHFEVVLNPFAAEARQRGAYVTTLYRLPLESPMPGSPQPGDGLGRVLAELFRLAPRITPLLVNEVLSRLYGETEDTGSLGELFSQPNPAPRFRPISTEIGVHLADAERALDAILHTVHQDKRYCFPGLIAMRYVQPTHALLGFTRFGPTCTIELPAVGNVPGTTDFYARVRKELAKRKVAYTLHWGQLGGFDADSVRAMYGPRVARWKAARRALLSPEGRRMFSNELLERADLAD